VAESAGQHESTGNVSRELRRGCDRRERVSERRGGEARIRVRAHARRIPCKTRARTCAAHHITHRSCIAYAAATAALL